MASVKASPDGTVEYRLNFLGIRVWKDYCCLIARNGQNWHSIGASRRLPFRIPRTHELGQSWVDELGMTAYQIQQELPDSGFDAVIAKRADFSSLSRQTEAVTVPSH